MSFELLRKFGKSSFLRNQESSLFKTFWIPAFAGMTKWGVFFKALAIGCLHMAFPVICRAEADAPAACWLRKGETAMEFYKRVDILGCPFDAISFAETAAQIKMAVRENRRMQFCPGSIDFVMKARRDRRFAEALWRADCVFADGVPIVWAASLLGEPLKGRVAGTDIVWKCAEISAEIGCTVALIGGNFTLTERAAEKMVERFPGANLHPISTPFPLGPKDNEDLVETLRSINTKIVLVALGAPRQERWIQSYLAACGANVGISIGSAFDIISGDKPRAPKWMCDNGFEWFYRMMQEPKRMGKRYLIDDSPFLFYLLLEIIKRKINGKRSNV